MPTSTVIVIDDDPSMRESLDSLLRSVGMGVAAYASVQDFLNDRTADCASCLVLDVRLPGQSGLDFQEQLSRKGLHVPVIFITGHADVPMTVRAMKAGAVEFLEKPFRDQDLLDAIQLALARNRERLDAETALKDLQDRLATLTARERQIMPLVAAGLLNKQIAGDLGVSEITVKVHRGQMMRKMGAKTLADLVRMADKLSMKA
ncbi:FixJ family two-component response regulator [Rhodoblastus acidophilus]|uniref:response regulator transcription factor n=1 Tax=Rhodoblastus acidophilus TaxID=1074 RepID=UPI00160B9BAB|nr:response regulator transcription factor [Rhodoblastus acidophilus]MCW2286800.1 FixJ family two-component response regulator [Rhodoblastus acidophilus]MCW2335653.1 FixJ family two-component response regulator [Rhodoblastus acidophilus]